MEKSTISQRKNIYKSLVTDLESSIFQSPQWLDLVSDKWDVLIYRDEMEEVMGAMPIVYGKLGPWNTIQTPLLTPHLGPVLRDRTLSTIKQNMIIKELANQVPNVPLIEYKLAVDHAYLPGFGWAGFECIQRLTARLDLTKDRWRDIKPKVRRNLNKAEKMFTILEDRNFDLLELWDKPFTKRNLPVYISKTKMERIFKNLDTIPISAWKAVNDTGQIVSGVLVVWDSDVAYYLIGVTNHELQNRGANTLLLYHAIKEASSRGINCFDFEGSMIEGVMQFFMSFQTEIHTYSVARKFKTKWHKLLFTWKKG